MMENGTPAALPQSDDIRAELDRVLKSDVFISSPQLSGFLGYVVEAALRGEGDRLKGYTIGVEALKRGSGFDPRLDPIVRVEAMRLRRALDRYYAGPGANAHVIIDLPRGSYVPAFRYRQRGVRPPPAPALEIGPLQPGNGMPILAIQPIMQLNTPRAPAISSVSLHDKISDAFSRFDTINIAQGLATASEAVPLNYELMGSLEFRDDGTTNARFRLLDKLDRTIMWSQAFEGLRPGSDPGAAEDRIVIELASTLVQPFGVIRTRDRLHHLLDGKGDPRYRFIVEASESFRSFDPAQHAHARRGLETLVGVDPSFVNGYSYLAALYFREFLYYADDDPDARRYLDLSLRAVRTAIEKKPESSRAHQILFGTLFFRHDIAAAFAAGDRAMTLNKYDMTVVSDYGGRLIMIGEVDRGMPMMMRAGQFRSVLPSWHHFYMFLGHYLRGNMVEAMQHANQLTSDTYSLGLLARALAAKAVGDGAMAANVIKKLIAGSPSWGRNPRAQLDKFFPAPAVAERLVHDLAAAGLAAD